LIADSDTADRADDMLHGLADRYAQDRLRAARTRGDFAGIAATIAEDRYSAGSEASRVTTYILLMYGTEAAVNFADDIEHHEG
jgi:hypothetical protein